MKVKVKLAALLGIAALAAMGLATGSAVAAEEKKPNIVVIWGDDIGITDVSAYS